MKKIIFLIISLICMISASYAAPSQPPLAVTFELSPSGQGVLAGNVLLMNCHGDQQSDFGGVIDKITPTAKASWNVPAGITAICPALALGGTVEGCVGSATPPLNATGTAIVTLGVTNGLMTCACSGDACQ